MPPRAPISPAVDRHDWFPPLPDYRRLPQTQEPDHFINMNWLYEADPNLPGGAPWIVEDEPTFSGDESDGSWEMALPVYDMRVGDLLLALVTTTHYMVWPNTVEGFTYDTNSGSTACRTHIYWRIVDGSEGTTATVTRSMAAAISHSAIVFHIRDALDPTGNPFGHTVSSSMLPYGNTPDVPSATCTYGTCWLYLPVIWGANDSTYSVTTYPAGWVQHNYGSIFGPIGEQDWDYHWCSLRSIDTSADPGAFTMAKNTSWNYLHLAIPGTLIGSVVDNAIWAYDSLSEKWKPQEWFDLELAHEDHQHYGSDGALFLSLDELEDVALAAPADKEFLTYESDTGDWINRTAAEAQVAPLSHVGSTGTEVHGAATGDVAGFMPAADKTKLDGVEAGATADQSANEIMTAVQTLDGTGSGLDADLLDGNEAAAFATAGHDHDADYMDIGAVLDDIADVNAPAPNNNDVLTWDSTPGEWVAAAPSGGSNALDDLTDVDAPTPTDQDVLTFDEASGDWVAQAAGSGPHALDAGQTDVTIDSPADNEVLAYDTGTSEWINQTPAEAGLMPASAALADLSDVDATAPSEDDVLTWDGDSWAPAAPAGGAVITTRTLFYNVPGALVASTGVMKPMLPYAITIVSCRMTVGSAPVGASLIVDVHKDGTTIFTTQGNRPTITTGNTDSGSWVAPDVTAFAADSYFTVDIDQIGASAPGANLVLAIQYTVEES